MPSADSRPDPADVPAVSEYRIAPGVVARTVGGLLILLAVLLLAVTVVVAVADLPVLLLAVVAVAGVAGVLVAGAVLGRVAVVHLGPDGYRLRLVRGVGARDGGWMDVREAVTATPEGLPVVRLRLEDGRSTTIPVTVLDVDREQFVRVLQAHLQRGQGITPLS